MGRQSKEESQLMWKLELESAKHLELTAEHAALIKVVTEMIEDYSLTYEEYLADVTAYLEKVEDGVDPSEVIKNMCNSLIEMYGKEVRSEQDQNGLSATECNGIVGTSSDNGGTEVLGEQLAEPSELLEEIQSSVVETSDCDR